MNYENENPWKVVNSKQVYENNWIQISHKEVINPSGGEGIYGVVHFKNWAIGIVVLDEEMNTYLVGQYRFPLNQYSWEIPEGGGALKTKPIESAKRELLEETGITAKKWKKIQLMHLSNSATDELAIIFLAQDLTFGEAQPEETEKLQVKKIPFEKAYEMVCSGEITDSLSVAGILKTKLLLDGCFKNKVDEI